jgi:hypothetical protein
MAERGVEGGEEKNGTEIQRRRKYIWKEGINTGEWWK